MKRKGLAHILFVLVRVCATAALLFYGNILLGRLFEWTPFGFPIWNFASACAACLASLIAFVVLMEVLWGRNGSRVACVFCGAVPLLLVVEPFIAAADLCDQQAEWTGAAVGLFALPVFVVLFRKAGTLVPGRFRRPAPADATKPALWALFLVCLLLPPFPLPVLGLVFRMLHGLDVYDTGNVMDARGGPWPFFAMRDATFVLLPAFAVLFAFAVRRFRPRTAVAVALALGLFGGGLRQCYVPEFEFWRLSFELDRTFWIRTDHRPEFSRNAFLRLPPGSTRDEVRAAIGDGYSGVLGLGPCPTWESVLKYGGEPPDRARSWQMTRYGNSESYWRCWVSFDEAGRLDEKYIGWWWD